MGLKENSATALLTLKLHAGSLRSLLALLDAVIKAVGLYNTAGFNDDTRSFARIPSRHDVWRRITCDWLAGMVVTGVVDGEEAGDMAREFAYGLAKRAYGFHREPLDRA